MGIFEPWEPNKKPTKRHNPQLSILSQIGGYPIGSTLVKLGFDIPKGLGSSASYQCHRLLRKLSKTTTLAPKSESLQIQIYFDENKRQNMYFFIFCFIIFIFVLIHTIINLHNLNSHWHNPHPYYTISKGNNSH